MSATQKRNSLVRAAAWRKAFTLVELLVVISVIGVLMGLLLAAVQAAREAGRAIVCTSNLKSLAGGCTNYVTAMNEFPYARKYDVVDTYTWTELIMPHIDLESVYNGYYTLPLRNYTTSYPGSNGPLGNDPRLREARHAMIGTFWCPSDIGAAVGNQLTTLDNGYYRGSYRGCVGSGDMYGAVLDTASPGPWGVGIFSVRATQSIDPSAKIRTQGITPGEVTDGLAYTILLSEGCVPKGTGNSGSLGGYLFGNMGGALFSANLSPNSATADRLYGPCPRDASVNDYTYSLPCQSIAASTAWQANGANAHAAARSRHVGGVNVAMADGAVRFVDKGVNLVVWRSCATRAGSEDVPQP